MFYTYRSINVKKTLANLKKEFVGAAPKNNNGKKQNKIDELVIHEDELVAENPDDAFYIQESGTAITEIQQNNDMIDIRLPLKNITNCQAESKASVPITKDAKQSRKGKAMLITSPEYREIVAAQKEKTTRKKNSSKNKKMTKSELETELLKAQLLNNHLLAQKQGVSPGYPASNLNQYDFAFNNDGLNQTLTQTSPLNFDNNIAFENQFPPIASPSHQHQMTNVPFLLDYLSHGNSLNGSREG